MKRSQRLSQLADLVRLLHDRDIFMRVDDSVASDVLSKAGQRPACAARAVMLRSRSILASSFPKCWPAAAK